MERGEIMERWLIRGMLFCGWGMLFCGVIVVISQVVKFVQVEKERRLEVPYYSAEKEINHIPLDNGRSRDNGRIMADNIYWLAWDYVQSRPPEWWTLPMEIRTEKMVQDCLMGRR